MIVPIHQASLRLIKTAATVAARGFPILVTARSIPYVGVTTYGRMDPWVSQIQSERATPIAAMLEQRP